MILEQWLIKAITQEHNINTNKEILPKWLQGLGNQPITWSTFVQVLRYTESGLNQAGVCTLLTNEYDC